jgi:hypothetical protein
LHSRCRAPPIDFALSLEKCHLIFPYPARTRISRPSSLSGPDVRLLETHQKNRAGDHSLANPTKLEHLVGIWQSLLPHRKIHISGDNIQVTASGSDDRYEASDMSDGEREVAPEAPSSLNQMES